MCVQIIIHLDLPPLSMEMMKLENAWEKHMLDRMWCSTYFTWWHLLSELEASISAVGGIRM